MEIISILSRDFSDSEISKVSKTINSEGFDLLMKFIKEQSALKSIEAVNSLPEDKTEDGMIASVISSSHEAMIYKNCFEILTGIKTGETELKHIDIRL